MDERAARRQGERPERPPRPWGFPLVVCAAILTVAIFPLVGALLSEGDGLIRLVVLGALVATIIGAVGAVADMRRVGREELWAPTPTVAERLRSPHVRRWLLGLPVVPVLALVAAWAFMLQPPPGGPWTRWDLLSTGDLVFWLVEALLLWSLVACAIAAVRGRGEAWERSLVLCAIPGLLAITLLPAVRKVDCPSQLPRDDLLEPLPPGTRVTARSVEHWRGGTEQILEIQADGEDSDLLERRAADWYRARGWSDDPARRVSSEELVAGDWTLLVSGLNGYGAPGGPTNLGAALQLSRFDEGCDWLS